MKKVMHMKKPAVVAVLLAVAVIAGLVVVLSGSGDDAANAKKPPLEVSVLTLQLTSMSDRQSLPGRVVPFRQSDVRPQVDGVIMERMFEEGEKVTKGQQLYKIDDARYKALLNSAQADLASANAAVHSVAARLKRYEQLLPVNAVSKQEYDDVKAEYDRAQAAILVAQAAVDLAQVNVDYTKVYAPITGQIGRSFVTEGALVTANQAQSLAIITQLDPIYVDMQQSGSGSEVTDLRRRMRDQHMIPVRLVLEGQSGEEHYKQEGVLKFSEVTVDETAASIAIRALFPNEEGTLLPGMFVRAVMDFGTTDALLVPQRATTVTPDGRMKVWVVDDENKVHQRFITATRAHENSWVATDGLSAGERVIVEGYQKTADGAQVNPVPVETGAKDAPADDDNTKNKTQ